MTSQARCQLMVLVLCAVVATVLGQVAAGTPLEQYQKCMKQFELFRSKLLDIRNECPAPLPLNCCKLKGSIAAVRSGVYEVKEPCSVAINSKTYAYCDMETDGGGWLVIQRRFDGTVPFNRTLAEYENGFGDLSSEFWYGLKTIRCLTQDGPVELRIDLEYPNGTTGYVHYSSFSMSSSSSYTATVTLFKTSPGVAGSFFNPNLGGYYRYGRRYNQQYYPNFYVKANCGSNPEVGGWWDTSCRGNPNGPGPGGNSTMYAMWNGDEVSKTEVKIRQKNCIASRCIT